VLLECYGDDTPLTFHDTLFFSLLILLVYTSKFNVHDTPITLPLKLTLHVLPGRRERNAKFSNLADRMQQQDAAHTTSINKVKEKEKKQSPFENQEPSIYMNEQYSSICWHVRRPQQPTICKFDQERNIKPCVSCPPTIAYI